MTPKCPNCKRDQDDCVCADEAESLRAQVAELKAENAGLKENRDWWISEHANQVIRTNEEINIGAELEAQIAALLVAIEAKDVALKSCGYADDSSDPEMCGPYFDYELIPKALALSPSSELLEARDRKRDAKLLRAAKDQTQLVATGVELEELAAARESGEWKPELGE